MSKPVVEIEINKIDLSDQRYKISFSDSDITSLALSIKSTGLINPPILRPVDDKYVVVSGFNRVRAHLFNNCEKISASVCPESYSHSQCLIISVTSLAFKKSLTHAELIKSISLLSDHYSVKELEENSIAFFNMKLNRKYIITLQKISNLPELALKLINSKMISLKALEKIMQMPEKSPETLINIFSKIKVSNSIQLEMITNLHEICARDRVGLKEFIDNDEILKILSDDKMDPVKKGSRLRHLLYCKRYPSLYETDSKKKKILASLKPMKGVLLSFSDNYELNDLNISMKIQDHKDAATKFQLLQNLIDNNNFKKIFNQ